MNPDTAGLHTLLDREKIRDCVAGGRYIDRLERRSGAWRIAVRTNTVEWSGLIPTMALPFADIPDLHGNGARRGTGRTPPTNGHWSTVAVHITLGIREDT